MSVRWRQRAMTCMPAPCPGTDGARSCPCPTASTFGPSSSSTFCGWSSDGRRCLWATGANVVGRSRGGGWVVPPDRFVRWEVGPFCARSPNRGRLDGNKGYGLPVQRLDPVANIFLDLRSCSIGGFISSSVAANLGPRAVPGLVLLNSAGKVEPGFTERVSRAGSRALEEQRKVRRGPFQKVGWGLEVPCRLDHALVPTASGAESQLPAC